MSAPPVALYGAPCSLYTAKVRSCLRQNRIAFEERFQSHPRYRDVILRAAKNHRIPVVEFTDGSVVQDSTLILDELERRFPVLPRTNGILRTIDQFLESFADRSLLRAAMHYRWNFPDENLAFITGEFGRILAFSQPGQWDAAGSGIAGRMSAYLPPLGITPEAIPVIESSYLSFLDALNVHLSQHPYLLGNSPSRADYGLMGPLHAHLGRDPYPVRIMLKRAPLVFRWIERMNAPEATSPEFPETDASYFDPLALPDSLLDVLRRAAIEYVPELMETAKAFATWCERNADRSAGAPVSSQGQDQPSFGQIAWQLEGHTIRAASAGHTLWMNQRTTDTFSALQHAEKVTASTLFEQFGAACVLSLNPPRRFSRLQNTLSLA